MEPSTLYQHGQNQLLELVGLREVATFVLVAICLTALIKESNKTDIPKVKNLPELPGIPLFGSLFYLGRHHARNCA